MARTKTILISGPMDAKHVSGVNVMSGAQPSNVESYFSKTALEPDELPSHTFVATGKVEVPRRSDTIASTIRRPSISIKSSLSRLRTRSISHMADTSRKPEPERKNEMSIVRSESARVNRPLRMQSSMSRLRQKVGLDKDLYTNAPVPRVKTPEFVVTPEPIQKDYPPLRVRKSVSRFIPHAHSTTPEPDPVSASYPVQRQTMTMPPQVPAIQTQPLHIKRRPSPVNIIPNSKAQLPSRLNRSDSGTAIDFGKIPVEERPLGFKEILAVKDLADRMEHYHKARQYWAHADHGLLDWAQSAGGPRLVAARA